MKFVIIGVGQFGRALALYLTKNGFEVTVIDQKESIISELKDQVADAIEGDATDIRLLKKLDLEDDTHVIIAVGEDFERNLLIAAQLKEQGVKHLYARSVNELQGRILKLIGATELFRVEDVAAKMFAARFIYEGLLRQRKIDSTHSLADVQLPTEWIGKTLIEVELRSRYHLNLLTIRRGTATESSTDDDVLVQMEQPVMDTPEPTMQFQEGDVLILFGKDSDLEKFVEHFDLK